MKTLDSGLPPGTTREGAKPIFSHLPPLKGRWGKRRKVRDQVEEV